MVVTAQEAERPVLIHPPSELLSRDAYHRGGDALLPP